MSYHEKQTIVNIFSGLPISAIFALIVYRKHTSGAIDITSDVKIWGLLLLIFIGVSIAARIIIQIIFHIINVIATREEDTPPKDERDKLISLRSIRNAYYAMSAVFFGTIVLLALGMAFYGVFIAFFISGLITEIVENSSQLYYYRKGI